MTDVTSASTVATESVDIDDAFVATTQEVPEHMADAVIAWNFASLNQVGKECMIDILIQDSEFAELTHVLPSDTTRFVYLDDANEPVLNADDAFGFILSRVASLGKDDALSAKKVMISVMDAFDEEDYLSDELYDMFQRVSMFSDSAALRGAVEALIQQAVSDSDDSEGDEGESSDPDDATGSTETPESKSTYGNLHVLTCADGARVLFASESFDEVIKILVKDYGPDAALLVKGADFDASDIGLGKIQIVVVNNVALESLKFREVLKGARDRFASRAASKSDGSDRAKAQHEIANGLDTIASGADSLFRLDLKR